MSWQQSTLGNECELYQPQTLAKNELDNCGTYKVYGANGVIGTHSKYNHENPQLLVTCRGATCGTINISEPKSWINGNAMVVKPRGTNIDLYFLSHYLHHLDISKAITGAAQPQITRQSLAPIKIEFPPLAEQKRIAKILDKAAAIKAKREQAIAKLEALRRSTFESMFGDSLINQNKHPEKLLSDLCTRIQIGPFGTQLHEKDYIENGIPVINPTHIKNGEIKPAASLTITTQKHKELSQYHLAQDDVIVGRRGEMGRCAVVTKQQAGWMCGTGSLFLQLDKTQINALYLQNVLSSQSMRKHLESVAQGVTMPNLNKDIVGGLSIPVPPISEQQRFNEITEHTAKLLTRYEISLAQIETTISSLQHQVFTTGFAA